MLHLVIAEAKKRNYILLIIAGFVFFMGLYVFLDFEGNENYSNLINEYGTFIFIIHLSINIVISILTSILVTFSIINFKLAKVEPKGSNAIPFVTFLFGLLTFGCTPCVVAFLAAIGIAFTPYVLPNGNLIWKFVALAFVIAGFIWIMYSIQNTKCKIRIEENNEKD
jgi:hypothetical protein